MDNGPVQLFEIAHRYRSFAGNETGEWTTKGAKWAKGTKGVLVVGSHVDAEPASVKRARRALAISLTYE